MLTKRRIFALVSITVIFAVFFGFFQSYKSQSLVFSLSKNTATTDAIHYNNTNSASQYNGKNFTGAFEIDSIAHISGELFDANKTYNFQYHLEYPKFIYISDTPIQNFLKAQHRQAQRDLIKTKTAEVNASFQGFANQNYKTLIYSLSYHINTTLSYQRMYMFLINSSGAYLSPNTFVTIASKKDFTDTIVPYIHQKNPHIGTGTILNDAINHWLSHPVFAFDSSDVILFFEAGTLAPQRQGNISVRIPYESVQQFISQNPKKTQELKEVQIPENPLHTSGLKVPKDGKKYIALTFDDGPNNTSTVKLLDILKQKGVKATFFVLGQNVQKHPKVLKRMHDEGHEIENHTWDHKTLTRLKKEDVQDQITRTDTIIKETIGASPKFVRPPYGAYNTKVRQAIGKPLLMWSVDPKDWRYRNIQSNITLTLQQTKNGSIILYHDIHDVSVRTIPRLIDELRMRGYEFTTVEKLFLRYQSEMPSGDVVCLSGDRCR